MHIECVRDTSIDQCTENSAQRVPDGKRFVIQTVSAQGSASAPAVLTQFDIFTATGGSDGEAFALLGTATQHGPTTTLSAADTRSVTLYADGGQFISFFVHASQNADMIDATLCLSGYLVPMTG